MTTREEATRTHTPGPWETADLHVKGNYARVVNATTGETIAIVVDDPCNLTPSAEAQANARLIAAAPDMLALLRRIMACLSKDGRHNSEERQKDIAQEARALIARIDRAEGGR